MSSVYFPVEITEDIATISCRSTLFMSTGVVKIIDLVLLLVMEATVSPAYLTWFQEDPHAYRILKPSQNPGLVVAFPIDSLKDQIKITMFKCYQFARKVLVFTSVKIKN